MTIAERITALRKSPPYRTQRSIAAQLGVSASYLSEIERGQKTPRGAMLERLAKILGTTPKKLLAQESEPQIIQISATTGADGHVRVACLLNNNSVKILEPNGLST